MRALSPILLAVLSTACAACAGTRPPLDDDTANAFLAAHNTARAAASPQPSPPLPALTYDASLADKAQAWAAGCRFEHSDNELGENLAFFSGNASTPEDVVGAWVGEAVHYDIADNACAPSEQCGHYTQVVWRDTERVGCGMATCTIGGQEGRFWVCNYDPPGNFVGERPY